ncbi:MAG TPA: CoA-binding protein [Chitinophagaceae bacterium]|jgi:predicted CoA-binding protein|nr:CoA-binding protein [Chitinophagaceae bacterium]
MHHKKTLVLGASENPSRYSFKAIEKLVRYGHPVVAIGKKAGLIGKTLIETEKKYFENIDTVTLYLNPQHQKNYYEYILSIHPKRIIFNPGAENEELVNLATANGIKTIEACTLVMLGTSQY